MNHLTRPLTSTVLFLAASALPAFAADVKPLRALLVAGGCCHDYNAQTKILRDGIQARANIQVDVVLSPEKGTAPVFPMYQSADWAKGYDVIIHDECAADIKDPAIVENILNAHKTIPAVNLHCAMHSYRWGNFKQAVEPTADNSHWYKFIGIQSTGHGPQLPIELNFLDTAHPITKGMANWTTSKDELYNNVAMFDARPLIQGKQTDAKGGVKDSVVAWTNEKAGARSFSTTLGHNNENVSEPRYLDLVTRGLLWSVNKLDADHQQPYKGTEGKFTVLDKQAAPVKKEVPKTDKK